METFHTCFGPSSYDNPVVISGLQTSKPRPKNNQCSTGFVAEEEEEEGGGVSLCIRARPFSFPWKIRGFLHNFGPARVIILS